MRYISVECEYFSAKFVPNPALLPELFLSKAMSFHSGGVGEQGKGAVLRKWQVCSKLGGILKTERNRFHEHFHPVQMASLPS